MSDSPLREQSLLRTFSTFLDHHFPLPINVRAALLVVSLIFDLLSFDCNSLPSCALSIHHPHAFIMQNNDFLFWPKFTVQVENAESESLCSDYFLFLVSLLGRFGLLTVKLRPCQFHLKCYN